MLSRDHFDHGFIVIILWTSLFFPPCCKTGRSQPREIIQNTHVGFCRAEGKDQRSEEGKQTVNLHLVPYLSLEPLSTHTHFCTHAHIFMMPAHAHLLVFLDISGENLALSSQWWNQSILNIYIFRIHTVAVVYMNTQMERWCAWDCAFFEISSCSFPSYVCLQISHACLFVHAQVTVCSATQHRVQWYARSICTSLPE